ncbi:uncharacterized protein DUF4395 [Salinibacterium amurskyense]|uniref:Uncharacterized protein DUF4395 n=1 Tax=Salinibacterium amurskyense TaxID=205941 RepID=A0A2M9DA73_9MICO|nr:DUF4395 domain-containing protein [Salinibacterium amurskyense]PJJ82562.1 uncharacterized protein DUF4395 [Salinibacterium amurskyense]RLQ82300.1 DUF4395 domain-containing protein [Salinibacterium amurskyense]
MPTTTPATTAPNSAKAPTVGSVVEGYDIPVVNERAVRVAAGILFLAGAISITLAVIQHSAAPLRPFGVFFMLDMLVRVTVGDRWSPTLALGRLIVRRQQPNWVGAPQKEFAWWLGYGLALLSCAGMGLLGAPLEATLVLCGLCLTMLFLEAAFGICVGCALQRVLTTTPPQYCPGDSCRVSE